MPPFLTLGRWSFLILVLGLFFRATLSSAEPPKPKDLRLSLDTIGVLYATAEHYNAWVRATNAGDKELAERQRFHLESEAKGLFFEEIYGQLRAQYPHLPAEPAVFVGVPVNPPVNQPNVSFSIYAKGGKLGDPLIASIYIVIKMKGDNVDGFGAQGYFYGKKD